MYLFMFEFISFECVSFIPTSSPASQNSGGKVKCVASDRRMRSFWVRNSNVAGAFKSFYYKWESVPFPAINRDYRRSEKLLRGVKRVTGAVLSALGGGLWSQEDSSNVSVIMLK